MTNRLINKYWSEFQNENQEFELLQLPPSYYFCDNQKDADKCAELVRQGVKQATTHSLQWFQIYNEKQPAVGDLAIVTDWKGSPQAIIRTTKVEIVKFQEITSDYALIEDEGDKSLSYWKDVHWAYYERELSEHNLKPSLEMELICEYFETIWPQN